MDTDLAQESLRIVYTNYRGETAERNIRPLKIWYGSTEFHPSAQWLLQAIDLDKQAERDFAMKDISAWL